MRFSGGVAGVAAAVLIIGGVAVIPSASAADGAAGTAAPASAPGTTLYVDPEGTSQCEDSGPGTQQEPFCTVQAAADVVEPGQTVEISGSSQGLITQPVVMTRSGTPTEPITFTWTDAAPSPLLSPHKQTGKPVITLENVHDVTISHLWIENFGTDDGIDLIGSSDISLESLQLTHVATTSTPASAAISIDGASSDVTVARSFFQGSPEYAVLSSPGAAQVTLTTNVASDQRGTGFALDGTADAVVTSNTVLAFCSTGTIAPNAVILADGSSGTVENNVLGTVTESSCDASGTGLSVDASSADSGGGVTADYNAIYSYSAGGDADYSWAGTSYDSPASFSAATGQGTHDIALTTALVQVPTAGSPAINSANCSAPGELGTDVNGNPWVGDPQAVDASLGNGGCNASRGAYAPQDSMPITDTPPALDATGYAAGALPFTTGLTVTGATTSGWGEPVSYAVNFGDGSSPAPASSGTEVTHTYTTAGQYKITITATDTSGSTSSTVLAPVYALPDQAPVAGLSAAPDGLHSALGINPDTADFTASPGSTGWEIASTAINYGGAGESFVAANGATWEYTYAQPGTPPPP